MHGNEDEPITHRDPNRTSELRLGEIVAGKYLVESRLGSGGMGTVLRAQHLELDQPVAIKVMHPELLAMEDGARRFALEARATAALMSPHAVRILDIDRLPSGTPFIVMELLEGIDLATMISTRGPLPVERAIHYLIQAVDAIAEAHDLGIIHRDLKPGNLFLTKDGVVKVLDFGLAKALHSDAEPVSSRISAPNILIGSPSYMSPEQLWPGRTVDERTDIWGLGATLFKLLAGEPPFLAQSLEALMTRIANEEPPRISDRRSDVSPAVDDVISLCLRKNPDERYRSISAFQGSLLHLKAALQSGGGTSDPGATLPEEKLPMFPAPDDDEATEVTTNLHDDLSKTLKS